MKRYKRFKWILAPLVLGGLLWITGGMVLAGRPAGDPPQSFRATGDLMPLLGAGLFLIGGSLGVQALALRPRGGRRFGIAAACLLTGALCYPAGVLVRRAFPDGGWEPLMPLGFLLVIAGGLLFAISALRAKLFRGLAALPLLGAALSLPAFNDQYTPWMACVFGLFITVFGCTVGLGASKSARVPRLRPSFKNKPSS